MLTRARHWSYPQPNETSRLLFKKVKTKLCKTLISPADFYGCESLSLTLKEEHNLKVFENRELRRIFVLNRGEIKGSLRELHNEELQNLYSSAKYN
jgi:hypothetical protein